MSLVLTLRASVRASSGQGSANEQLAGNTEVRHEIRLDEAGSAHVLAYPEPSNVDAYRTARKRGIRDFTLWQDRYRQRQLAVVTTQSGATNSRAVYLVHRPTGEVIGTVSVDKASLSTPHRTRWTIRLNGHPAAVGRKGQLWWWFVWWLLSPIQAFLLVGMFLSSSGGDLARMPRRTIWRVDGKPVLDYRSYGERYHLPTRWLDPTMAAAVVALHQSHPSWLESAWDDPPPRNR